MIKTGIQLLLLVSSIAIHAFGHNTNRIAVDGYTMKNSEGEYIEKLSPAIAARINFYLSMAPAQVHTSEAFVWFTGIPDSFFNAVLHFSYKQDTKSHVDDLIAKASPDTTISFFVHPFNTDLAGILKEKGFRCFGQFLSMSWNVQPVSPSQLKVQLADAKEFLSTLAITYGLHNDVIDQFSPLLEKSTAENYLAYVAEKPVGTGSLFVDGKHGLILHISTLSAYQKQGIGRAMMHFLMHRAYALGLETLVLYCPAPIESFYTSLGFNKECEIEIYDNEGL